MSTPADLVSLSAVKSWLAVTSSTDDLLLGNLITAASRAILGFLGRPSILPASYADWYDGRGTKRLVLRRYPVLAVSSLVIDGIQVPQAPSPAVVGVGQSAGYLIRPASGEPPGELGIISLAGYAFNRGRDNVAVGYSAGYQVAETRTVPVLPYQVTPSAPWGPWASDSGVSFVGGAVLTAVSGTPAAGQYSVSASGLYTFASADVGKAVLISYGYVPQPLVQACMELVAERYRYKDRIGVNSKSIGGQETVSFNLGASFATYGGVGAGAGMTNAVLGMIQPFRAVAPGIQ